MFKLYENQLGERMRRCEAHTKQEEIFFHKESFTYGLNFDGLQGWAVAAQYMPGRK